MASQQGVPNKSKWGNLEVHSQKFDTYKDSKTLFLDIQDAFQAFLKISTFENVLSHTELECRNKEIIIKTSQNPIASYSWLLKNPF